jgi:hypothetical protein
MNPDPQARRRPPTTLLLSGDDVLYFCISVMRCDSCSSTGVGSNAVRPLLGGL